MYDAPREQRLDNFHLLGWLTAVILVVCSAGCHRAYYREQADREAYELIAEKSEEPASVIPEYSIQPDPRSRMFDPFDPDHEPMPPDDPASHQLMHCVDHKRGYPCWHADGDTSEVQNPDWRNYLPLNDEGVLVLDSRLAMQLALLHSPEYQQQLETLYLSALDVSTERFRFDTQFYGGYDVHYDSQGGLSSNKPADSLSTLTAGTLPNIYATKAFSTGSELVVEFANTLVWQFAGPDTYEANTLMNFALIQPLLRGAGRNVVLEQLTLAERTLLANVRQMERFRRGYSVQIMTGRDAGSGPSRRGGVFGAGLEGFTGLGSSAFGRLSGGGVGGGGGGATGGTGGLQAGGFIGLLQTQQELQNQQDNLNALRSNYFRLLVTLNELMTTVPEQSEEIVRQRLQVAQSQTAVLNAESRLLNGYAGFQESLDSYKETLGIPPDICIRVRDPMFDDVSLIDPAFRPIQNHVGELQQEVGDVILQLLPEEGAELTWTDRTAPSLVQLRELLEEMNVIRDQLMKGNDAQIVRIRADGLKLGRRLEETLRPHLTSLDEEQGSSAASAETQQDLKLVQHILQQVETQPDWLDGPGAPSRVGSVLVKLEPWRIPPDEVAVAISDPATVELRRLKRLFAQFVRQMVTVSERFDTLAAKVARYQQEIDALVADGPTLAPAEFSQRLREQISPAIPQDLVDLSDNVIVLSLMQARDRAEIVSLVEVDLHPLVALDIAREHRRDWMNARADLVNTWRAIQFIANELESGLDIVFSGDLENDSRKPLRLDSSTGKLRVGIEFDAPLTRLQERNKYRESLIQYQQARRSYYQSEDRIHRGLRNTLRGLQVSHRNFEIRREAVRTADLQIELNDDIRKLQEASRQPSGPTAARDAVSALSDLLTAQNDFLSVWVTYDLLRRYLDFDLGTMEIDLDGMWIDPGPMGPGEGYPGVDAELDDPCWPGPLRESYAAPGEWCPCVDAQALEMLPEVVPAEPSSELPLPAADGR